jgi:hypothetical protein
MVTASPLLFVNAVLSSSISAAALFSHNRAFNEHGQTQQEFGTF